MITSRVKPTLSFTGLKENVGDDLVDLTDKLEKRVIGEVFKGELSLSGVSRVLRESVTMLSVHNLQSFGERRDRNPARLDHP